MVILEICDRKAYRIRASQLSTLRNDKKCFAASDVYCSQNYQFYTYGVRLEGWADGERNGRPRHARIAKNAAMLANIVTVHVSPRGLFPQLAVTGNSWFLTTRSPLLGCRGRDRYTHARRQARTEVDDPTLAGRARSLPVPEGRPPPRAAPLRSSRHFIAGTLPHLVSSNIYSPFPRSKEVEV